ncbi:hypothetical protein AB0D67_37625 [Streptosporangium sp. NPDC048047]|uniref:hypothetical protein n=1 Tax=Streptosporangium sp. NPDC048047 TaxID=3155748 RepID=UPI00342D8129
MTPSTSTGETIAHDVRQLFARVGIPQKGDDAAGGYDMVVRGSQVRLMWWPQERFNNLAWNRGVDHPDHPLSRLERATTVAMERAMADVLYAAGFSVGLVPGVPSRDADKTRDPEVWVAACPEFKAWMSD